jgi:hypothetical protein
LPAHASLFNSPGYRPPAEYDYIVDYSREEPNHGGALLFPRLDATCVLGLPTAKNPTIGMSPPQGQPIDRFQSRVPHSEGGCRIKIQVRNNGITIFVNGVKIIDQKMRDWKAPRRPAWIKGDPVAVGVLCQNGKITIRSAEVVEISGTGTMLH